MTKTTHATRTSHPCLDLLLDALPIQADAAVCAPSRQAAVTRTEPAVPEVMVTPADIVDMADLLGIDFAMAPFSLDELRLGFEVEAEHARLTPRNDVVGEGLLETGMRVLARLHVRPDYYSWLIQPRAPGDVIELDCHYEEIGAD